MFEKYCKTQQRWAKGLSSSRHWVLVLGALGLCQNAMAQAVQEVVITGNPLGRAQGPSTAASLSGLELSQSGQGSLGETLNSLPGVSSTYFGPNASRPIVRGLDGDRIRVLSNSGASLDVSALSYDHAVPLDVLSVERIEVLRGPASLQYGGSAVGGVVNVIDNRIPRTPFQGVLGKAQAQSGSGNGERSVGALLETGSGRRVLHVDAFDRKTDDVKVPQNLACSKPGSPVLAMRICNSDSTSKGGAVGGSLFFDQGFLGLAVNEYKSNYGTVAEDEVTIDMYSKRVALEGQWKPLSGLWQSVQAQASQTRYQHTEFDAGAPGTVFANQGHDFRLQGRHRSWAGWEGAWGWQSEAGHFSAAGDEAFAPYSRTQTQALFVLEELSFDKARWSWGLRREQVKVRSFGNPDPSVDRFETGDRKFTPQSFALGARFELSPQWLWTVNAAHTQRAPKDYELFANGPHIATAAWERGDSALGLEKSGSVDLGLEWQVGANKAALTAFQSRFSNFIGLLGTGLVDQESGLPIQNYQGVRARFSGFEASGQVRLMQSAGSLDLGLKADLVRAVNQSLNEPLPRISPLRMGANLRYAQGPLTAHLGLDAYAAQNRVPVGSMVTAAYTLWHGGLGYRQKMELGSLNWFVRVDNLSNQWAYSASSILTSTAPGKAPLPGRSVKFGVVANF